MTPNQNSQTARAAAMIVGQAVSAKTEQILFSLELIDREDKHILTPQIRSKKKADLVRELQAELVAAIVPQVTAAVDAIYAEQRKEVKRKADDRVAKASMKDSKKLVAS